MIASRQVESPFYIDIGRQRGWGSGELAQAFGRSAIPFLRKFSVPAAKRVGADLLELLRQKLQRFLVVEGISGQLQRVCENRL